MPGGTFHSLEAAETKDWRMVIKFQPVLFSTKSATKTTENAAEKVDYLTKLRRDFETQVTITPRPDLTCSVSSSSSTSTRSGFRDLFKLEGGKFINSSNSSATELVVEDKTARYDLFQTL